MEDRNIENWEQDLKNKLGAFREETDAKDLDLFMNKLDNNDFFQTKAKIPSIAWAFVAGLLVTSLAICLFYDEPVIKVQEVAPVNDSKSIDSKPIELKPAEAINRDTIKIIDTIAIDSIGVIEERRDSAFTETVTDVDSIREIVEEATKTKRNIDQKQKTTEKSSSKKDIQSISDTEKKKETKETKKDVPLGRKRIIIMSADTTILSDTTHVKHRIKD